jgi:hypothetical protein
MFVSPPGRTAVEIVVIEDSCLINQVCTHCAVLLAAYQVQLNVENNSPQASIWAEFSQSSRSHIDEIIAVVNTALAVAV